MKATNGDTFLGGEDFDNALLEFLVSESKRTESIDLSKDRLALQRLREAAHKAKIERSSTSQTEMNLPFITADASGAKYLNITLTRSKFEALVNNLIEGTRAPCQNCLKDGSVYVKGIDEVLLVTGLINRNTTTPIKRVRSFQRQYRSADRTHQFICINSAVHA